MKSFILLLAGCLMLMGCAGAPTQNIPWSKLQGLGQVDYRLWSTHKLDGSLQDYHIFIRLPEEYEAGQTQHYPTVYLLDGGLNFPLLASYYRLLRLMNEIPPLILVGIAYGSDDWREGNNRSQDFTLPSEEREFWGGAAHFEAQLRDRLFPRLEQDYAMAPDRRILFGQSLGGQFALYTSMYGQTPFYAVIASNPALHRNPGEFLAPVLSPADRPKTFLSLAGEDNVEFRVPMAAWRAHWHRRQPDWQRRIADLPGHNHLSANPEAFRQGLKWVFETAP
ncbi:alpha/beta hydrolase-fold protein [Aliiglaciecola sp. CAU 1673]|uniref:alpha/beta hydrolase n=1 Tax=Aliiglaciecola sp. CAU 1673 TaxID=3032595 RepID=UPI0023DC776E|nr:alpha/beta hydrolase-fold protein [Aliiglaciecola sp. CAU 1673]MDF2176895.1 alpha/beta hydrolase-fold protein [Aliiglaciecola sp. CAU 1673]